MHFLDPCYDGAFKKLCGLVLKKLWLVCLFLIILFIGKFIFFGHDKSKCNVLQIDSYQEIQMLFNECNQDTLVLFDVDDTLISSPDPFARGLDIPFLYKLVGGILYPSLIFSPKAFEEIYSIMFRDAPRQLIEERIVDDIEYLKNKGVTVLGLTSMESGPYGVIPSMPEWRYQMLYTMGVTFTPMASFNNALTDQYSFSMLSRYRGHYPLFYKGILCANQVDKGTVLKAYLTESGSRPTKIIFFDDGTSNLHDVGRALQELGIDYTLVHYCGAEKNAKPWNFFRLYKQIKALFYEKKWPRESIT